MNSHLHCVTAESVRRGHPDKLCDQIADRILDAYLTEDPNAHAAIEVMATSGEMLIAGEVCSTANVSILPIVKETIRDIGYAPENVGPDGNIDIRISINEQSPDIVQAVTKDGKDMGAGDQGIVVGYATDETPEMLPLPVVLAHRICRRLDNLFDATRMDGPSAFSGLGADGKAQVTVLYDGDVPVTIAAMVVSFQHNEQADLPKLKANVRDYLMKELLPGELLRPSTRILINPSGRFAKGGPAADTGLTGRKLAVDLYGPAAHIGGGALSGKDATKTDRSGAYAARWVAKCIVASGLARQCEVQIAYAIGRSKPVSVDIDGELMLTILASFAQAESKSVSDNCKWRIRKDFSEGKSINLMLLYGYRAENGKIVIVEEEAAIVRRIFREYLDGRGSVQIAKRLAYEQVPKRHGGDWSSTSVIEVLTNEKYTGDSLLQKTFVEDHLTKKQIRNTGQLNQYYAENTHPAIIDHETYERAQQILAEHREFNNVHRPTAVRYPFSGKIVCGNCGANYNRRTRSTGRNSIPWYTWQCATYSRKGKQACPARQIPEETLEELTCEVLGVIEVTGKVMERLEVIRVVADNRLQFVFRDGHIEERQWAWHSRAGSWTPEMCKRASDHAAVCSDKTADGCAACRGLCPRQYGR